MMMEEENTTTAQSQSNGIAIAEPVNCNNGVVNTSIKPNGVEAPAGPPRSDLKNSSSNNNEDTSISSSVMSDSGGEEVDEVPLLEPDPPTSSGREKEVRQQKKMTKARSEKKPSFESEAETVGEDGPSASVRKEKER
jgi:hypothetical protein